MNVTVGQLVISKAGRDKGRKFFICKVNDLQYVELVDGSLRKIENPKKKKIKHINVLNIFSKDFQNTIGKLDGSCNAQIRKILMGIISDSRQGEGFPDDGLEMEEVLDSGQG